ncbi:interferon-related developmental regulator 1 [Neltuma alba]|uniref:interferon-related developmental regulator 1 n=1 Tax=Neltuma alba TaxID=207710 RepID=UPI0010A51F57|nr:interferon-related developmental regulator 1 [Prosopis alba]
MGKRNSQRKNAAMMDSDDESSSVSSSSTVRSDRTSVLGNEEVHVDQDTVLDKALDALDEKRGSTREKALSLIIDTFNSSMQHQFVEKKFATLLHQCLGALKKGSKKASANEIALAAHAIGLLALTVGCGDNAREIYEESVRLLDESLSGSDASKISSLVRCLAITTFVGGTDQEETEKSMDIMWRLINPKLGSNVVSVKPSPSLITAVVSAWSFLLSTVGNLKLNSKSWQNSITYLSSLLDKEDRSVRIVAGEALALIFEVGVIEKSSAGPNSASDTTQEETKPHESYVHIHGLKGKVIKQVKNLAVEAGGKGSAKKDLNTQRDLFRDISDFFEYGYSPEITTKVGGDSLQTSSWSQMIQLNFFKHFLGGGFIRHMQENEFLHDVFEFTPKRRNLVDDEHRMSVGEKRMFKSPNSVVNKARTQLLNKQRLLSEGRNFGHYAVNAVEEEA